MKIAIDKNTLEAINDKDEFIYLYEDEPFEKLLETGLHCINYRYCEFVDINLTDYDVECLKKCKITDKNWDKIEYIENKIGIIIPNSCAS